MCSAHSPSDETSLPDSAARELDRLIKIMARLRDPDGGCPWDLEQTFETIAPYTLEEAYEVVDAIADGNMEGLLDELGDLLLQVVFHSRMAEEKDLFRFADVAAAIADKMIRRHPHVFGEATADDSDAVLRSWEQIKAVERSEKNRSDDHGVLDGIARATPALVRARKLQSAAASVGFDWPDVKDVFAKVREELDETATAAETGNLHRTTDEVGDLLFAVVNLARHLEVEPETALRSANERFRSRFRYIEQELARQGMAPSQTSLARLDALWEEAKALEEDAV